MEWNTEEVQMGNEWLLQLLGTVCQRRTVPPSSLLTLRCSDALPLVPTLSCSVRGAPILHLLSLLGLDLRRPFRWRLEHKLVQALCIHQFAPDAFPVTRGLCRDAFRWQHKFEKCFAELYGPEAFVKATLGYASFERALKPGVPLDAVDASVKAVALDRLQRDGVPPITSISEERYVVQERLAIAEEFRVYTIEGSVVEDLTAHRFYISPRTADLVAVEHFVISVADALPDALTKDTVCAWDVAKTTSGLFKVLEINYMGFHPVFEPGFQCAGQLLQTDIGPVLVAKLMLAIEHIYRVSTEIQSNSECAALALLYSNIMKWRNLLSICADVHELIEDVYNAKCDGVAEVSSRPEIVAEFERRLELLRAFDKERKSSIWP